MRTQTNNQTLTASQLLEQGIAGVFAKYHSMILSEAIKHGITREKQEKEQAEKTLHS